MQLQAYLKTLDKDQLRAFVRRSGLSRGYLSQIAHYRCHAGLRAVQGIASASNDAVTGEDLRPELFLPDGKAHTLRPLPSRRAKHSDGHGYNNVESDQPANTAAHDDSE